MTDMLEKIARAIADEVERQVQKQGAYSGPQNDRPNYIDADVSYPDLARAALLAMREPSWSLAAVAGLNGSRTHVMPAEIQRQFTAMIDAILKEGGE